MFIGEWGIDSSQYKNDDGTKRGYKDSRTVEQYANELIETWKQTYKPHKNVLGTAIYCIGNNGKKGSHLDWRTHDVFNNDSGAINENYLAIMEQFYKEEFNPTPIPIPNDNPSERHRTLYETIDLLQKYWNEPQ